MVIDGEATTFYLALDLPRLKGKVFAGLSAHMEVLGKNPFPSSLRLLEEFGYLQL